MQCLQENTETCTLTYLSHVDSVELSVTMENMGAAVTYFAPKIIISICISNCSATETFPEEKCPYLGHRIL